MPVLRRDAARVPLNQQARLTMTTPGFTATSALGPSPHQLAMLPAGFPATDTSGQVTAAAHGIECHIGHCGCYFDDWFGSSCLCCEYW
jgi:hypothetical protein